MKGYRTYVVGADSIFYDAEFVKTLKAGMDTMFWWRMGYNYQSIWRNLHIDGFEGYLWNRRELPAQQTGYRIFFTYETSPRSEPSGLTVAERIPIYDWSDF